MDDYTNPNAERRGLVLPERVYDLLKDLVVIALPAVLAGFASLAQVWGMDELLITRIVATVSFIIVVLGTILKISNVRYQAAQRLEAATGDTIETPVQDGSQ